ncbi:tetratricopeptide repeat protein [Pseudomonas nitroreducens]|uniref:tetratricopeptide repeat protein n=1 Tax=Pseudomonas nitroreducens TaxID=46680 RepID=UPI00351CFBFE
MSGLLHKGMVVKAVFLIMLVALIIACYWRVGDLGFVWDDQAFLVEQQDVRAAGSLYELMFKPFFISSDYYRPLVVLTYALQYRLFGLAAADFHWLNVYIHCFNSVMIALIALRIASQLGVSRFWALVTALFYAVHPATIEATAWVSGRFDLMMASFLLLAVYCDVSLQEGWSKSLLIGALFGLAAFCKETAVGFALCYPFWRMWLRTLEGEEAGFKYIFTAWRTYAAIFLAGVFYLMVRLVSMGYLLSGIVYNDYGSGFQRLLLSVKAFVAYFWTSLFPYGKISPFHYQAFPVPANDSGGIAALVGVILLVGLLCIAWRSGRRQYAYAVLTFFLSILAALHLLQTPLQDNLIQERYLQFPLALFLLMALMSLARVWRGTQSLRITLIGFSGLMLIASCANVLVTVPLWKNSLTLWTWASQSSPESSSVWANRAAAHQEFGQADQAVEAANRALKLGGSGGTMASALVTLGNVENIRGNLDKAADYYMQSFEKSRELPSALVNMLNVLIRMKEYDSAKWYIDTASGFDRALQEPYFFFNCGLYYLSLGDKIRAKENFDKAVSMIDESRRASLAKAAQDFFSGQRKIEYWKRITDS